MSEVVEVEVGQLELTHETVKAAGVHSGSALPFIGRGRLASSSRSVTLTGLHAVFGRHRSARELLAALERLEVTGRARQTSRETRNRS